MKISQAHRDPESPPHGGAPWYGQGRCAATIPPPTPSFRSAIHLGVVIKVVIIIVVNCSEGHVCGNTLGEGRNIEPIACVPRAPSNVDPVLVCLTCQGEGRVLSRIPLEVHGRLDFHAQFPLSAGGQLMNLLVAKPVVLSSISKSEFVFIPSSNKAEAVGGRFALVDQYPARNGICDVRTIQVFYIDADVGITRRNSWMEFERKKNILKTGIRG